MDTDEETGNNKEDEVMDDACGISEASFNTKYMETPETIKRLIDDYGLIDYKQHEVQFMEWITSLASKRDPTLPLIITAATKWKDGGMKTIFTHYQQVEDEVETFLTNLKTIMEVLYSDSTLEAIYHATEDEQGHELVFQQPTFVGRSPVNDRQHNNAIDDIMNAFNSNPQDDMTEDSTSQSYASAVVGTQATATSGLTPTSTIGDVGNDNEQQMKKYEELIEQRIQEHLTTQTPQDEASIKRIEKLEAQIGQINKTTQKMRAEHNELVTNIGNVEEEIADAKEELSNEQHNINELIARTSEQHSAEMQQHSTAMQQGFNRLMSMMISVNGGQQGNNEFENVIGAQASMPQGQDVHNVRDQEMEDMRVDSQQYRM